MNILCVNIVLRWLPKYWYEYDSLLFRLFGEYTELVSGIIFIEYIVVASLGCIVGVFFVNVSNKCHCLWLSRNFNEKILHFQPEIDHNLWTSANYFVIALNVVFSMLITSYMGSEIEHESAKIPNSIYNAKWYRLQTNLQYQIFILLLQAQRPHILTGLKILPCNYMTFKDVTFIIFSIEELRLFWLRYFPGDENNIFGDFDFTGILLKQSPLTTHELIIWLSQLDSIDSDSSWILTCRRSNKDMPEWSNFLSQVVVVAHCTQPWFGF